MKRSANYIVVPFRLAKGRFFPGEMRKAETEAGALRLAEAMAARFAGVAAFEVIVDEESGDKTEPRGSSSMARSRKWMPRRPDRRLSTLVRDRNRRVRPSH